MTRTEERLTDALRVAVRHGQELALRPLTVPERARPRWARRLAPAAAAAAVALIVAGALALTGGRHAPRPGNSPPPAGTPRYYVVDQQWARLVVRATATGAVTDHISNPRLRGGAIYGVAAGDGGREFVAAFYDPARQPGPPGVILYSFGLTSAGRVTGLHPVRGGVVSGGGPGFTGSWLAVSPDGSKVALPVSSPQSTSPDIVVVDLRTGAHSVWAGGLRRPGFDLSIPSISWTPDGRTLVFLSQWCRPTPGGSCDTGLGYSEVRTLGLGAGGGSLAQGHVLLHSSARYPYITQAQLDPGGGALTVVVLNDLTWTRRFPPPGVFRAALQVIRVPLAGNEQPRLLYRHGPRVVGPYNSLQPDASGQHWLLVSGFNGYGWLSQGKLHLLPPQDGSVTDAAW